MTMITTKSIASLIQIPGSNKLRSIEIKRRLSYGVVISAIIVLVAVCDRTSAGIITSDEANHLALESSGKLIAPQGLAERIEGDLALIRATFPHVADIHDMPAWLPGQIRVGLSETASHDYQAGTYHELDPFLNAFSASIEEPNSGRLGLSYLTVLHDQRFHPERMAELIASLESVTWASPNHLVFAGDSPARITVSENRYTFTPSWRELSCPLTFPQQGCEISARVPSTFVVSNGTAVEVPEPCSAIVVLVAIPFAACYSLRRRIRRHSCILPGPVRHSRRWLSCFPDGMAFRL